MFELKVAKSELQNRSDSRAAACSITSQEALASLSLSTSGSAGKLDPQNPVKMALQCSKLLTSFVGFLRNLVCEIHINSKVALYVFYTLIQFE